MLSDKIKRLYVNPTQDDHDNFLREIDELLWTSEFEQIDVALAEIVPEEIESSGCIRSILCFTACVREKLKNREKLYERLYERMIELVGLEKTIRLIGKMK